MGADIHVKIIHKSEDGWKPIYAFRSNEEKNTMEIIKPYPFRDYEIFNILLGREDNDFPYAPIFKKDLPQSILDEINEDEETLGYYGFHEINLADLKLYAQKHPTVKDYEAEYENDKPVDKINPIINFINRIESYINFVEPFWIYDCLPSNIRILYWFDH